MIDPNLFADLEYRGLIKQATSPEIPQVLAKEQLTVYAGFDPTADSLHVGSLLPLLTLRRFQNAGHKVIALVGGATGMIGDPSGKTTERSLLTPEQMKINQAGITAVVSKFLDLEGPNKAVVVNNADWFAAISYIDFLRDVGKHFTVNHMVAKESVRARLEDREHGISYTEFSYMVLQAYDFYHLYVKHGCRLQIGGSDQWGNITAGTDLIRKCRPETASSQTEAYGLTFPLVMKADGTKFGKSEKGTIWLDPRKTSPYQLYQFLVQTGDQDALTFAKYFTFLQRQELDHLAEVTQREPEKREAQKALAREVTRLVHGEAELERVESASRAFFGTEIRTLDARTLTELFADAPSTKISKDSLSAGIPVIDLLVESKLCGSKGAARKDITGGGIYLNNERVSDPATVAKPTDLIAGAYLVLRKGKKNYHLVQFE